jgi:CheY-like chemotaxis protein
MDEAFNPENKERLKKRILVADDEEMIREITVYFLDAYGYEVVTVKDGQELLDKLNSGEKFDAVISDNNMPKMKGIEVLEYIRKNPKFEKIPFILRSGMGDSDLEQRVKEFGGKYLEKPDLPEDLKNLLKEVLD